MMADHCEVSQLMSLALVRAAHGCLYDQLVPPEADSPAQQDYNGIALRGNETEHEDVFASTIVA